MYSINSSKRPTWNRRISRRRQLLSGRTPRHAATDPAGRSKVEALIDEMECVPNPGRLRWGKAAYNYNVLRAHVGLDEVSA